MLNILASVPIITYCVGSLKIFYDSFNNDSSELKPVMAITVDGGGFRWVQDRQKLWNVWLIISPLRT